MCGLFILKGLSVTFNTLLMMWKCVFVVVELHQSGSGLDLVSSCHSLGLDLISTSQSLGLVWDLVSVVVLTTPLAVCRNCAKV